MTYKEISIESPIPEKVAWAENCYKAMKARLLGDEKIADLLLRYRKAAVLSHGEMNRAGVVNECKDCEEREGGSCCGDGLEDRYNGILLLINLLLDKKLPEQRHDKMSCYFLGQGGCLLLARHVICVNYVCHKITEKIDPAKLALLREKEGNELEILFFLHERVKELLTR
jgi:hypothetical protein